MKAAVTVFPGSNCDYDCYFALNRSVGLETELVWHKETNLNAYDAVIIPGGFSYGDYLRCGAIAKFSPIMQSVVAFAQSGKPVLGICNGFQILLESGLLPGALLRNEHLRFICKPVYLKTENNQTLFTRHLTEGQVIEVPIAHGEGNYYADQEVLDELEKNRQVVFRYCSEQGEVTPAYNPNGSLNHIAGIINKSGNVLGMMPHPERVTDAKLGGTDGLLILNSLKAFLKEHVA